MEVSPPVLVLSLQAKKKLAAQFMSLMHVGSWTETLGVGEKLEWRQRGKKTFQKHKQVSKMFFLLDIEILPSDFLCD
jgi:hypothetical protein